MYLPDSLENVLCIMYAKLDDQYIETQYYGNPDKVILGARIAIGDLIRAIRWADAKPVILVA